eukprot:gene29517-35625_t
MAADNTDERWLRNSVRIFGPLSVPSRTRMYNRFFESAISLPKMFLSGFLWEGFGLASGMDTEYTGYYFMTGLGGGIGTLFGHVLVYYFVKGESFNLFEESIKGSLYGMSAFFGPSTLWQKLVNDMDEWGWSFTSAFFFMWFISGLVFYVSMMSFRCLAQVLSIYIPAFKVVEPVQERLKSDLTLSLSVGLGDAFFLGTAVNQFPPNGLTDAFGVGDNTEAFEGMMKAGTSVIVGFSIMQIVENLLWRTVWTDDANEDTSPAPDKQAKKPPSHDEGVEATTYNAML